MIIGKINCYDDNIACDYQELYFATLLLWVQLVHLLLKIEPILYLIWTTVYVFPLIKDILIRSP